jgi:hypothetical protein
MKNLKKFFILLIVITISVPAFISCKKGDGDPFFSFYTRKQRLTGDWKVTKIDQTVEYKTTRVTTKFDGSKMKVDMYVTDTTVDTPYGTFNYYEYFRSSTGEMLYTFGKTGTYQIDEAFTDDSTFVQYTSQEKGLWYFTGGGRDSDTKTKELLGLQPTSYIFNPLNPNTYNYTYTGNNEMYVYHIYRLASKEIELHYDVEETTNLYTVKTHSKITLEPK